MPMAASRLSKRARISRLIALLCILSALIGSFAFFTDRVSVESEGVAGNIDLVFTDVSASKSGTNGILSNNEFALDNSWGNYIVIGGSNINPGDYFDLSYALANTGSKSVDVRQQLVLTTDVPMTPGEEGYQLSITGGKNTSVVPGVLSDDKLSITYDLQDLTLDGSVETEPSSTADTLYTVRLDFLPLSGNEFSGSKLSATYKAQAKQHRNTTDSDWATWAEFTTKFEQVADSEAFFVAVQAVIGGRMTANPNAAAADRIIVLDPAPNGGYTYLGCSVSWEENGTPKTLNLGPDQLNFVMPAADVTITPSFSLNTYSISYEPNGGEMPGEVPTSYSVTTETFALPEPTRTGYTFAGWYANPDFSGNVFHSLSQGNVGDRMFYAKWDLNAYSISYDLAGGTATNPTSYSVTTDSFTLSNPTKIGYTFTGWTGSNGGEPQLTVTIAQGSTGDKSYTANWTANTDTPFTVNHWLQNLGADATQNEANYTKVDTDYGAGTSDTKEIPNRNSYDGFTAPEGKQITIGADGQTVLDYYYTRNSYTFTLGVAAGVNTAGSTTTEKYHHGTTITVAAEALAGYTWDKWVSSNPSLVPDNTSATFTFEMPMADITLTPRATANVYNISYDLAGGTVANANPATYTVTDFSFMLNNPTRTGYTFLGWTGTNGNEPEQSVTITQGSTGDRSYTANWSKNTYTIGYDLAGGTVAQANPASYDVTTATITLNNPTRLGYTFLGWTGSNGGTPQTTVTIAQGSTGNKTYTANWQLDTYSISYNLAGGAVAGSNPTSYDVTTATFTLNNPTKNGFTFNGWTGSNGNTPQKTVTITKGTTGALSYTANWIDDIAPVLTVNPLPETTENETIPISGTATDASDISSVVVTVGSTQYPSSVNGDNEWSVSATLAEGPNTISVVATDGAGNKTTQTHEVVLNSKITFTLGGTSYTAKPGMTWAQWVSSAYNTVGATVDGTTVKTSNGSIGYNGVPVNASDAIGSGYTYEELVAVTIVGGEDPFTYVRYEMGGTRYYDATLYVPVGTQLICSAAADGLRNPAEVYVNGVQVGRSGDVVNYNYTVTGNTVISCETHDKLTGGYLAGFVNIWEGYTIDDMAEIVLTGDDVDGDNYATINITGLPFTSGNLHSSVEHVIVPPGTEILCEIEHKSSGADVEKISVNGTTIMSGTSTKAYTYTHIVGGSGIVTIDCSTVDERAGVIQITDPNLITFSISGTTYVAKSGMTWNAWASSAYNTDGVTIDGTSVKGSSGSIGYNGTAVSASDVIGSGYAYEQLVTITLLTETSHWDGSVTYVTHNGIKYTSPTTFKAAVGDTISIVAGVNARYGGQVTLNGSWIARGEPATYEYTVVSNATFDIYGAVEEGWATITDDLSIVFTISGTPYAAKSGMTWSEWIGSEFDTSGNHFVIYMDIVCYTDALNNAVLYQDSRVYPADIIVANGTYEISTFGGGGSND